MENDKLITRREFLMALGGLALVGIGSYPLVRTFLPGVVAPLVLPQKPTVPWNGSTKTFMFDVARGNVSLGDGRRFSGYLINGQFPGPTIRVREGDKVRITLNNHLDQPTTLHWHGVDVPSPMDGVPGISENPIPPGKSFTYEFIAGPSGTRWYHSHVFEMDQIPNGLFGAFVIEPASGKEPYPADREMTLILSTWGYQTNPGFDYGMQTSGGMGQMMMGGGNMVSSSQGLVHLINGSVPSSVQPITVRAGEKLRLRLINASASESYWLTMDTGSFMVTHTDGNPLDNAVPASDLYIAPAERYDIVVTPTQSGKWFLRSKINGQESIQIPFSTDGSVSGVPSSAPSWSYSNFSRGTGSLPKADQHFQLTLSSGMMMGSNWTINGASYPKTTPLRVKTGDRVRIEMQNMSMMEHPMHLHGHPFEITSFNGKPLSRPLVKDVVNLRPMERCTIDFLANNPGNWFFHCHNLQHMRSGLATVVEYVDYPLPHIDKWM
ncbi:multicopper oxidase family protein [Alicyclobacillus suci]|uniref:multicopper oxidase family protein n=1 Tax=Alicyclobacillus suci TaxID=2816080 RepID=UPI001A8E4B07|nr:multicopper oxidase family protein [Alicyclobacillus suci]